MNPNQQSNQPFQPSVPPPAQYQQTANLTGSMLPHKPSKVPLILAILFGLLFFGAAGFGLWAYSEREDYKNNSVAKSEAAVKSALAVQKVELSEEFAEQAKEPFVTFNGPGTYGSFTFDYPRTWSVYTVDSPGSSSLYTVYLHPGGVKDVTERGNLHAFSLEVVGSKYEEEIRRVESAIKQGTLTSATYRPKLVEEVLGLKVVGEIENDIAGQRIFLPLRDRTFILTTESEDYGSDYERILSTFSFTP